jgi:formate hydrogenlyase transcriptional activator
MRRGDILYRSKLAHATLLKSDIPNEPTLTIPLVRDLAERERAMIENALREAEGLISGPAGAAAKLGVPRQTLESKIRKLGINRHRFRTS